MTRRLRGDQNVTRIQVAVDDEVLMRVLYSRSDLPEQLQSFGDRKLARVAVVSDRLAFDEFHRKVRQSVFGHAAIQQSRDVRVIQIGQNLAFVAEAARDFGIVHARP